MPKFKRLPKSAKPFKFELLEDFTITPRFDREFWLSANNTDFRVLMHLNPAVSFVSVVGDGMLEFKRGGMNNGLTCHRDHSWAINCGAPHGHDLLLGEGYIKTKRNWLTSDDRAIIDRVFLSVLLDHVDTLSGWKKARYKFYAYAMYCAVRANSIIKGVVK